MQKLLSLSGFRTEIRQMLYPMLSSNDDRATRDVV